MKTANMENQKSGSKLTRTHSSLLSCSSPAIRSSIHSLSSIVTKEEHELQEQEKLLLDVDDDKNNKPKKPQARTRPRAQAHRSSAYSALAVFFLGACSLLFYFFYLEVSSSENVLLALIFVAVALYFVSKNKGLIQRSFSAAKHSWEENVKRLGFSKAVAARPVQWFIGEPAGAGRKAAKIVREGVEFYSNGDFYEGEFHKGRSNGSGVYHYFVNGRYEGDWVDGRYDGYGIESWARGSRYRGQYRQGLRHGYGVYRFYTGDSYSGEWCNGQSHGVGLQTCSDASCYIGQFKYGVKHGLGCYHFRNGDRYAGEYFGDKIHGFGVYHFANGHCYEGAWHEGRRQGIGSYTFRNGDRRCGEWDAGNLKQPLPPLSDVVLRAVQAARKTAESAINLKRVDDQVNKAVIAASKAATAARVAAVKAVQNRMDGKFCVTEV
ncbi:MORN repeat-containing protein 1 [Vigna radiata var. radiata]|uniref:MORN repeat-containing protein 1 n=1 Tax=Vigna radiata var. radiata TaxID=3916 RepID=A0A1S3TYH3_VIGRR|nr:MORN repeat-containing protein 1 [Vigna radiata var. radiata]